MRDLTAIRSADNPRFRALLKLVQSSRERRDAGLSVLDGAHLVAAYLGKVGVPQQLVASESGRAAPELAALFDRVPAAGRVLLSDGLFAKLSSVVTPTGIIGVVRTPRPDAALPRTGACVMLENLQDPGNLGSILRSTAAAGVAQVLLSRNSVHAWSPRVLRAGMGAHFSLQLYEGVDLVAAARGYQGRVIATSQRARATIFEIALGGDVALVFGNEGCGISPGLRGAAHAAVAIPMPGRSESLNVAAAAAICLFERVRQREAEQHSLRVPAA